MTALNTKPDPSGVKSFDLGYKLLHWSMAILMILMLMAVQGFASVTTTQEHETMLIGHSSIGFIISVLVLIRVAKRFIKRSPRPVQNIAPWQQLAAKTVQFGLYFCMVFIPVTGYLTARSHQLPVNLFGSFDLSATGGQGYDQATFDMLRQFHETGIKLFMLLLVVHIGAVVYHRFIAKDGVLASMTRGSK